MPISSAVLKKLKRGCVFIETGTYEGDGIATALDVGFEKVISIELDADSVRRARARFVGKPVTILYGDTAKLLPDVLADLCEPATFWLDAHPVGWSPVMAELAAMAVANIREHTILVDDRRLMTMFHPDGWFTPSEKAVLEALLQINPAYEISFVDGFVPDDIIVARLP